MNIVQINIADTKGGACVISWNLHKAYRRMNMQSSILVKHKFSDDSDVRIIDNEQSQNIWFKTFHGLADRIDKKDFYLNHKIAALARFISSPGRMIRKNLGIEEFNFPGLSIPGDTDIVHCHVLHGDYFDLSELTRLSSSVPVIITLHDAWLLAGHCAHSFDCELWKTGCSKCPDITIPVAINRDNSAYNWRRKRNIYRESRLYISTPCKWLMDKVELSILSPSCIQKQVIPNGVDQDIFRPGNRTSARKQLGLNEDEIVLMFSAHGIVNSRWKDYQLMKKAVEITGINHVNRKIVFLAVGQNAPGEVVNNTEIRFVPFVSSPEDVALYYQASDIYLHAAKAETFPNSVLEALSCGIPVIATAVGGIPEQVRGWNKFESPDSRWNTYGRDEATGILVEPGNPELFAKALSLLILDDINRVKIGDNAKRDAQNRFPVQKQIAGYLDWYRDVIKENLVNRKKLK